MSLVQQEPGPEDDSAKTGQGEPTGQAGYSQPSVPPIMTPPKPPQTPAGHKHPTPKHYDWHKVITSSAEISGLTVLVIYTVFSCLQWLQIRWTNRLTREALNQSGSTLQRTLDKMQGQIDATNSLYGEAKRQADEAQRSANYANQALIDAKAGIRLEESPWVDVVKLAVEDFPDGSERLTFEVSNAGKSPAFEVHALSRFQDVSANEPPPTFEWNEKDAKGTITFIPNPPEPYSIHLKGGIPPDHVIAFRSGISHAYMGLALWYRDYWGIKHFDRFCEYFQPESQQWVARKPDHCQD